MVTTNMEYSAGITCSTHLGVLLPNTPEVLVVSMNCYSLESKCLRKAPRLSDSCMCVCHALACTWLTATGHSFRMQLPWLVYFSSAQRQLPALIKVARRRRDDRAQRMPVWVIARQYKRTTLLDCAAQLLHDRQ